VVLKDDKMVQTNVDLFGAQSWTTYTVVVSDSIQVSWSGIDLWGWFQNFALKWGRLDAPKSCPTGFIAVPWNAEFMQPWFCVAKYEMSYESGTTPNSNRWATDWNTIKYSSTGVLVSQAWLYPIAEITQIQAIAECKRIAGHLITNNEWMTIARNIEYNWSNWNSWQVGNGGLYKGIVAETNSLSSLWCFTADSNGSHMRSYVSTPLSSDTTKWGANKWNDCDSKRQHKLNNGEVIWDLAGNIMEHVNGRNTIEGANYQTMNPNVCWLTGEVWNQYSYTHNDSTDTLIQCVFTNGFSYANLWPKTLNLNAHNWIGRIFTYNNSTTSDRIFLRGGNAVGNENSGLFSLSLNWDSYVYDRDVGFRCAY